MIRNGVVILFPLIGLNHISHNWLGWWSAGRGIYYTNGIGELYVASWEHTNF